jgi:hypothetical protein
VSRLTFNIDPGADFVGAKRKSPWGALRASLFGIDTPQPYETIPEDEQSWKTAVQRFSAMRPAAYSEPLAVLPLPLPAKIAIARTAPTVPVPAGARYQMEYKARLILASQLEDGGWTAIHLPLDADPSAFDPSAQRTHRFMARILAIASAEIEIDELEQAAS